MMKPLRMVWTCVIVALTIPVTLEAQTTTCPDQGGWTTLNFPTNVSVEAPLLLTDGRIMAQYIGTAGNQYQDWWALTPDPVAGYATTNTSAWSELASLRGLWSPEYGPYGYSAAVLADGRVIVQGGEWNLGQRDDTPMGGIYTASSSGPGSWQQLQAPLNWNGIGDAPNVVLPNKKYMVGGCCSEGNDQAQLDPATLTWNVLSNNGKQSGSFEQGWTLLPGINGGILTVDTGPSPAGTNLYEIFSTSTQSWTSATIPVQLYGNWPSANEIGPALQLMDGTIFATGASQQPSPSNLYGVPGNTAIYNPSTNNWTQGPTFPFVSIPVYGTEPLGMGDEQAVVLPDGNVFMATHSQPHSGAYYYFMEYLPSPTNNLCFVSGAPGTLTQNTVADSIKMIMLPTGQVLVTTFDKNTSPSTVYYLYTPRNPSNINSSWQPSITTVPSSLTRGTTYQVFGYRFNGLTQGSAYGDEFENATNYPIIRITNNASGHVFYAKTHDHSTMAVATGINPTYTSFEVSQATETGSSTLVVIANGIVSSNSVQVTVY